MEKTYKKQINKYEKSIATTNLRKIKIKRDQASFLLKIRSFCFEIRQHCSQAQKCFSFNKFFQSNVSLENVPYD